MKTKFIEFMNEILLAGAGHRLIPLTQGKFAIVDTKDYERLAQYKWHAVKMHGIYYARRKVNGKFIQMHREILNVPVGFVCDHKNHNGLDNRRCNLRICTHAQNIQNSRPRTDGTSRYKGVSWNRRNRKWRASICHGGHSIYIGYYDYEADAAIAYDDTAIELFGEFACLNFHYRPEIKQWLADSFFFCPTKNDMEIFEDDLQFVGEPPVVLGAKSG